MIKIHCMKKISTRKNGILCGGILILFDVCTVSSEEIVALPIERILL